MVRLVLDSCALPGLHLEMSTDRSHIETPAGFSVGNVVRIDDHSEIELVTLEVRPCMAEYIQLCLEAGV